MLREKWIQESKDVQVLRLAPDSVVEFRVERNADNTYNAFRFCSAPGCESGALLEVHDTEEGALLDCEDNCLLHQRGNDILKSFDHELEQLPID